MIIIVTVTNFLFKIINSFTILYTNFKFCQNSFTVHIFQIGNKTLLCNEEVKIKWLVSLVVTSWLTKPFCTISMSILIFISSIATKTMHFGAYKWRTRHNLGVMLTFCKNNSNGRIFSQLTDSEMQGYGDYKTYSCQSPRLLLKFKRLK